MQPQSKERNSSLIAGLLGHDAAVQVLQTPLFSSVHNDHIKWNFERNMQYSVRSAYGFCVKEVILGNYFRVEGRQDLIWRAKILPKVNSLNWRICRNCLPTGISLHDKGVNCPQDYVICDTGIEHICV